MEKGADPNIRNNYDNNAILSASAPNKGRNLFFIDPEVIQLLLDHKADITVKDEKGKTALDYMKENEEFKKTKLFKKLSAQFDNSSK